MKIAVRTVASVFVFGLSLMSGPVGAADAENGEILFKSICAQCHSVEPGSHRTGPSLHKIWGHQAGAAEGFGYSDAFQKAGASGLVWTEENLDKFIRRPRSVASIQSKARRPRSASTSSRRTSRCSPGPIRRRPPGPMRLSSYSS